MELAEAQATAARLRERARLAQAGPVQAELVLKPMGPVPALREPVQGPAGLEPSERKQAEPGLAQAGLAPGPAVPERERASAPERER
ncbi:MAG: hypothetical protein IKT16_06205, partial [Desulfovibrio sp.]|nr:hypothetical protein [Desulfovibrio sp.]